MKIYVCSPYRGDQMRNVINAQIYCKVIAKMGHVPVAPHIFFTQFLNDNKQEERDLGIKLALKALEECDQLWLFDKVISEGMSKEIKMAKDLNIPIRRFELGLVEVQND